MKHDNSKIQLGIAISRQKESTELVSLGLGHLSGIFILWIIGIALAIVAFIIEWICYYRKKRNIATNLNRIYRFNQVIDNNHY